MVLDPLSDGELAALSIAGDRRAFGRLMHRHREPLYRLIRGHLGDPEEALDVMQDVFVTAYRHLNRFDQSREFRPWISRIAINRARDWHRRRRLRALFGLGHGDVAETVPDNLPGQHEAVAAKRELERAWKAIAALPERLRETLLLRTIEGLSQAETAQMLRLTEKAVETRLYRARMQLKENLAREG